jgi:hypothetical protein
VIFCFLGFNGKPDGWLSIEGITLKICGIGEKFDVRQLKEIILQKEKIILTNIYGESKYSFELNLDYQSSEKLKTFLEEKLQTTGVSVINSVAYSR